MQERVVVAEGGCAVAIGALVSPQFLDHPEMFADDHFHPSAAGYSLAVAELLPPALAALRSIAVAEYRTAAEPGR